MLHGNVWIHGQAETGTNRGNKSSRRQLLPAQKWSFRESLLTRLKSWQYPMETSNEDPNHCYAVDMYYKVNGV